MPSRHVLKLFMPNEFSLFEEKNITEQGVGLISGTEKVNRSLKSWGGYMNISNILGIKFSGLSLK